MDFSYVAGFFDADGSINLARNAPNQTKRLVVCFTNADLENLQAIEKLFPWIKGHYVTYKKAKEHHSQTQDLRYSGENAEQIMYYIESHICNRKKKERWRFYQRHYKPLKKRNGKYSKKDREAIEDAARRFNAIK